MGTWGTGIFDNDDAADLRGDWRAGIMDGRDAHELSRELAESGAAERPDPHEQGLLWLALAAAQSETGRLDAAVRDAALAYIADGADVSLWTDDPASARRRQGALDRLAVRLSGPQPAPKRLRRPTAAGASAKEPGYPFIPRSNAYLRPGQFWAVPLKDGRFAAGRVIHIDRTKRYGARSCFVVGLADWVGDTEPTAKDLKGVRILTMGDAAVITIRKTGGEILGITDLPAGDEHWHVRSRGPFPVPLYRNGQPAGLATREQMNALPVWSTWGFMVIERVADAVFVEGLDRQRLS